MLTEKLIRSVCPNAHDSYVAAFSSDEARATFDKWGMNDPDQLSACMANVAHETGGMRIVRESGYYSAGRLMAIFGLRYRVGAKGPDGKPIRDSDGDGISDLADAHHMKPRLVFNYNYGFRLGNERNGVNDDDGWLFRGGGPLQSTGADNYRWLQRQTGLPFFDKPETIEIPEHWPLVTAVTWCNHLSAGDMRPLAAQGNFEAVCRGINTGSPFSTIKMNGWKDRQDWFLKWSFVLGAPSRPAEHAAGVYRYGMRRSIPVTQIQKRLNGLRYGEGRLVADGMFGARTRSAVLDFQTENGLAVDGIVGPQTWGRLFSDDARPYPPPASAVAGVSGLRAMGEPGMKSAEMQRAAGYTLGISSGMTGLAQSGTLDYAQELAKDAGTWQALLTTLISATKFGAANVMWIVGLIGAIILIRRYGAFVWEKVERWSRPIDEIAADEAETGKPSGGI